MLNEELNESLHTVLRLVNERDELKVQVEGWSDDYDTIYDENIELRRELEKLRNELEALEFLVDLYSKEDETEVDLDSSMSIEAPQEQPEVAPVTKKAKKGKK